jgi:serine/threonine-protein kinase
LNLHRQPVLNRKAPDHIGRYRLIRRIGRGGSGEVYLARLEAAGGVRRLAAVKILFHAADDPRHHEALLAEARLGALLTHPNVAQVLDAGVDNGLSWFAMEFVAGLPFNELLDAAAGQFPPWIAARIVAEACAAVHALHEATDEQGRPLNVVHRDVTPHNLLVSWDGDVKLVDLGVAHSALRGSVTKTGVVKGKLGYMSPEQASGAAVDRRCDVFALGVQLWEALAGRRLFKLQNDSETLAAIVRGDIPPLRDEPGVPAALADVVAGALAMDPTSRIPTALEMQRALEVALGGAGVVIGASDVGRFLAHVAPDRVREHIRWPDEARSAGEGMVVEEPPSPSASRGSVSTRRRRRSNRLTLAVTAGVLAVATGVVMSRSAADRSAPARAETVPSQEAAKSPLAATAAIAPPAKPNPPATPEVVPEGSKPATARTTTRRTVRPPPGVGTLYVSASPTWATITLDGKPAGTTPTVFPDLPAGSHTVVALPLGKGPPVRRTVTVAAGSTARIGFEFEEP